MFEIWMIISRLKINNFWKFTSLLPAFLGPHRIVQQSYQRIETVFEIYLRALCNNATGRSSSLILTLILWITLSKWNLRIEFNLKVITARNEISITTIMNHYSTTKKRLALFFMNLFFIESIKVVFTFFFCWLEVGNLKTYT